MSADNVLALPEAMTRQWQVIERGLRAMLQPIMSAWETDQVIEAVRPVYMLYGVPRTFHPAELQRAGLDPVAEINAYVRGLLLGLMGEIVTREALLIRAGISSRVIEASDSEKSRVLPGPWKRAVHDPEIPVVPAEVGGL